MPDTLVTKNTRTEVHEKKISKVYNLKCQELLRMHHRVSKNLGPPAAIARQLQCLLPAFEKRDGSNGVLCRFQQLRSYRVEIGTQNRKEIPFSSQIVLRARGALGYLEGCKRSLSKFKNTPKALISGQKSTLILIKR